MEIRRVKLEFFVFLPEEPHITGKCGGMSTLLDIRMTAVFRPHKIIY